MCDGINWWMAFGPGALTGAIVTAAACGKARMVSRAIDRLLDEDEWRRMDARRSIRYPSEYEHWSN